jgi:hypothetical protein
MRQDKGLQAPLLTALEREQGLCPTRSNCRACANVEYIYFTGVVCRSEERKIGPDGKCLAHLSESL